VRADPAFSRLWRPAGILTGIRQAHSSHHDRRPDGMRVALLVIHGISLPPGRFGGRAIERLFTGRLDFDEHPYYAQLRGARVSAHFLVRRSGEIVQFVPCDLRAWHAGVSSWGGRERCNDFSIGVELEGTDLRPYGARQYRSLAWLTRAIRARYPIDDVVGHRDIAPGRKTDPGPAFDWNTYRAALARHS
jgi:AmpD protein